ncbi:MAG: hypothetical protein ACO363_09600, partial [Balneolaceae bacterium]
RLLKVAMKKDRLSILSDSSVNMNRGLSIQDISPRSSIPEEYSLHMIGDVSVCEVVLRRVRLGVLERIPLPGEGSVSKKKKSEAEDHDSLQNLRQSLRCGVVAFEGSNRLYQTQVVSPGKGKKLNEHEISVQFRPITPDGDLTEEARSLVSIGCNGRKVVGINQNCRYVLMERHFESTEVTEMVFPPLRQYIGEIPTRRFFPDIDRPPPRTFEELNEQQRKVAHPVSMKTAMEVAGPPGKTPCYHSSF